MNRNHSIIVADDRQAGARCPICQRESRAGDEVAVCQACGAMHHRYCWDSGGHCGSYQCTPARRSISGVAPQITINMDELSTAMPLPRRSAASIAGDRWTIPPVEQSRTSKLAVWFFVTAILGIPLVGMITGLLAIILGCTALSAMAGTRLKGTGWAVAAVLIGLFDMVAWIAALAIVFGGRSEIAMLDFQPDMAAMQGLTPEINRIMRANVLIESELGGFLPQTGIGSGVILQIARGDALIVTNRHVIDGESVAEVPRSLDAINSGHILVKMVGQLPEPAQVVWVAPAGIDAALLRVRCETDEAQAAPWGAGAAMHVGDPVLAIGNPHNLGWTLTQGSISQFRTQGSGDAKIRVIQTQAAINHGNSGGGLYDKQGMLIGINTWTNDKRFSEGISFAIAFESILALQPAGLKVAEQRQPLVKPNLLPAAPDWPKQAKPRGQELPDAARGAAP